MINKSIAINSLFLSLKKQKKKSHLDYLQKEKINTFFFIITYRS